ncbi:MAG: leucyl/phenylalanyl-tRNA--protein transferase [Planctomycetota bacterium]
MTESTLRADTLLQAYRTGLFPMARGRGSGRIDWFCPDPRAVLPLDDRFKVRRSLAKRVRNGGFVIARNRQFREVVEQCARPRPDSSDTWISPEIVRVYVELHQCGHAHSVEAYRDGRLVGGLYGVSFGGAFFGESMFSREPDASQVCLVKLIEHLREREYALLDTQFVNPHLEQFGVLAISRSEYLEQLAEAIALPVTWSDRLDDLKAKFVQGVKS